MNENNIALIIIGLLQAANFFYVKNLGSKLDKLGNGCFTRHIDLAKKEGQTEMTLEALHSRIDKVEEARA